MDQNRGIANGLHERPVLHDKLGLTRHTIAAMKQACARMTKHGYRAKLIAEGMPTAQAQASTKGHDALFTQLFNRVDARVDSLFHIVPSEADEFGVQTDFEAALREICDIYIRAILDFGNKIMRQQSLGKRRLAGTREQEDAM